MMRSNIYGTTGGIAGYGTVTNDSATSSGEDLQRPKAVFYWKKAKVMEWLQRHCEEFYGLYGGIFLENEITGRSLIRINEETLLRMGIDNAQHRQEIARMILKLKLKSDMIQLKELEIKANVNSSSNNSQTSTLPKASSQNNNANSKTFGNFIR